MTKKVNLTKYKYIKIYLYLFNNSQLVNKQTTFINILLSIKHH